MMRKSFLLLHALVLAVGLFGQGPKAYVDFFANSTGKKYLATNPNEGNIWALKEHDCSGSLSAPVINLLEGVPKYSQAHLEAMLKGNTRISNQTISAFEGQFLQSMPLNDNNGLQTIACATGRDVPASALMQNDMDYFRQIIYRIRYLRNQLALPHRVGAREYRFEVLNSPEQLDKIVQDPLRLGMALNVKGAHCLGNFLAINNNLTNSREYEATIMRNVDRLKGLIPLEENTTEFLELPILSLSFDGIYDDGMCGKTRVWDADEEKIFGRQTTVDQGLTPLGEKVIKRLLAKDGRRIILDVSGMSLAGRQWYLDYLKNLQILGDTIPILASHSAISGLIWSADEYVGEDRPSKNAKSWLNNYKASLSRQDIVAIYKSYGLIGITLDSRKLTRGTRFEKELAKTVEGSAEQRELIVKLLAANMIRVVQVIQDPAAWDIIAISSEFDDISRPFAAYASAEHMDELARDLKKFFEAPTDIFDLYTVAQIKTSMYDLTPDQLISKIMSENGIAFLRRSLIFTQPAPVKGQAQNNGPGK